MSPRPFRFTPRRRWLLVLAVATVGLLFVTQVWKFLSTPTQRVDANILVVEGWVFDYCIPTAAAEFKTGRYAFLATSGLADPTPGPDGKVDSIAANAARRLIALGVDPERIIICPAPATGWNRTSSSARAVREQLAAQKLSCTGINILTTELHTRQSWLAYRRIFKNIALVGIIRVPSQGLTQEDWWKSKRGWRAITKLFCGWVKECLVGYRD